MPMQRPHHKFWPKRLPHSITVSAGPMIFDGYWKQPAATAAAFIEFEGKRFFRSGDLGRVARKPAAAPVARPFQILKTRHKMYGTRCTASRAFVTYLSGKVVGLRHLCYLTRKYSVMSRSSPNRSPR